MKNNPLASNAGFGSRFLVLMSAFFGGKGFFTKIGFVLVIIVLLVPNLLVTVVFSVLVLGFVAVIALTKDKDVEKVVKKSSKGVVPFAKYAINGDIGGSVARSVGDSFISATGGKLDVELRKQGLKLVDIGSLKKFFKLLKIKDKQALKLVKANDGSKVLSSYIKTYGTLLVFQRKLNKEKEAKKVLKNAAKARKMKVSKVTSWSATPPTP